MSFSLQKKSDTLCFFSSFEELIPQIAGLKKKYESYLIFSDDFVFNLYGEDLADHLQTVGKPVSHILYPQGEMSKTWECATACWNQLIQSGADRSTLLIAIGGGVTSDLAGFIAGIYMRGIDFVVIPTTLLSMTDAAIGGKSGINFGGVKNLLGIIRQPRRIYLCEKFLETLPERELISGMAESVKHAVIGSEELFALLSKKGILSGEKSDLREIIIKSAEIKIGIVSRDEQEEGERALLNYGHTFGHALESATDYTKYLHGEAVSIGMSCAGYVGKKLGMVEEQFIEKQDSLCLSLGLPIKLPSFPDDETLLRLMKKDKKSISGKIRLIVPEKIGKVISIPDVPDIIILEALKEKRLKDERE